MYADRNLSDALLAPEGAAPEAGIKGRFAPSPSGRMHLGNLYAAFLSYLSAKSRGGCWLLRIEDNDPGRSRDEWARWIMDDLQWLGLGWDEGPCFQSRRGGIYADALGRLARRGLVYPCRCTRHELRATQAPHPDDGHTVYGGRCRPDGPGPYPLPDGATLRLRVPPGPGLDEALDTQRFDDALCGPQCLVLSREWGDFVMRRRDGAWAYQLAAAVDDALMGVTEVVRGDDLLRSVAPQRYVQRLLGLEPPRRYVHLPLLRSDGGQRLSKRDGSLAMDSLRARMAPADVLALVCRRAGLDADRALALAGR